MRIDHRQLRRFATAMCLALPGAVHAAPDAPLRRPPLPPPRLVRPSPLTADPPLPPARPLDLGSEPLPVPIPEAPPPAPTIPAPSAPLLVSGPAGATLDSHPVCVALLASGKVTAVAAAPVHSGACGIAAPIELSGIVLTNGAHVAVQPPVEINCGLGNAVADWIREDIAPVFGRGGSSLTALTDTGGYECRARNRIAGGKLSEHAKGNAMDIGHFVTADGNVTSVRDHAAAAVLAEVERTACARFSTVLGPGSDGYHERHMHVDLEMRQNGSKYCHWRLQ